MKDVIRTILSFDINPDTLLLRDSEGSTPLHAAVQRGFPESTRLLLKSGPSTALHLENGVGETPLEIATFQEIVWRTRTEYKRLTVVDSVPELPLPKPRPYDRITTPVCGNLEILQVEVPKLRTMIEGLLKEGKLHPGTKLMNELLAFADRMEGRLAAMKANPLKDEVEENKLETRMVPQVETCDRKAVRDTIRDTVNAQPGPRGLIHLIDAQTAVQYQLARVKGDPRKADLHSYRRRNHPEDEEDFEEEDVDEEEKKESMLFAYGKTIQHRQFIRKLL